MKSTDPLRQHLINLLTKAEAHIDVRKELKDFPVELRGRKPAHRIAPGSSSNICGLRNGTFWNSP